MNQINKDVIATRIFSYENNKELIVYINRPKKDNDDYICHYQIEWGVSIKQGHAYGVDSLQSLLLAIKRLNIDLITINKTFALKWLDMPLSNL